MINLPPRPAIKFPIVISDLIIVDDKTIVYYNKKGYSCYSITLLGDKKREFTLREELDNFSTAQQLIDRFSQIKEQYNIELKDIEVISRIEYDYDGDCKMDNYFYCDVIEDEKSYQERLQYESQFTDAIKEYRKKESAKEAARKKNKDKKEKQLYEKLKQKYDNR